MKHNNNNYAKYMMPTQRLTATMILKDNICEDDVDKKKGKHFERHSGDI